MAQNSEIVEDVILDEFVDDASTPANVRYPNAHQDTAAIEALIYRIATEMQVPQFNLEQVIQRVLGAVEPTLEERVRAELERLAKSQRDNHPDSFAS